MTLVLSLSSVPVCLSLCIIYIKLQKYTFACQIKLIHSYFLLSLSLSLPYLLPLPLSCKDKESQNLSLFFDHAYKSYNNHDLALKIN